MSIRNLPEKIGSVEHKENKVGPRIHPATSADTAIRG
jgi:hypothetical protein